MPARPGRRSLGDLSRVRRQALGGSGTDLVEFEPWLAGRSVPQFVRPRAGGVDLAEWVAANRDDVERLLRRDGAVVFRGFGISSAGALDRVVRSLASSPLAYRDRSSPRSQVEGNVYTSTDHPPEGEIFLHNEQSYSSAWPSLLAFCCATPASEGGRTPVADCRQVYASLAPAIRQRFERLGVMYVRNLGRGLGLDWQVAFQTDDPAEVERRCAEGGMTVEWRTGQRLRTRHVRPVSLLHPVTGEAVWFNHATFFHVSTLEEPVRDVLTAQFASDELPWNTFYGDASPIEPQTLEALRQAYRDATVSFEWRAGDLLVLDNMLVAHGRTPYAGDRSVLVAMAAAVGWDEVETPGGS